MGIPEWSLLLSSFALLISGLSYLNSRRTYERDRADIRINLGFQFRAEAKSAFSVQVTNHGRRVAFVHSMKIEFKAGFPLWDSIAGGESIGEGQVYVHWLPIHHPSTRHYADPRTVKRLIVIDTFGNRYKYPKFSFNEWVNFVVMKEKIKEEWSPLAEEWSPEES